MRVPKVAELPVRVVMKDVTEFKRVAKSEDDVALVLVKLLIVPVEEKRLVTVPTVVEEVLRTV